MAPFHKKQRKLPPQNTKHFISIIATPLQWHKEFNNKYNKHQLILRFRNMHCLIHFNSEPYNQKIYKS